MRRVAQKPEFHQAGIEDIALATGNSLHPSHPLETLPQYGKPYRIITGPAVPTAPLSSEIRPRGKLCPKATFPPISKTVNRALPVVAPPGVPRVGFRN